HRQGCFDEHNDFQKTHKHVFPIEYPSGQTPLGCIEINTRPLGLRLSHNYDKKTGQKKNIKQGCFQPDTHNKQSSSSQNTTTLSNEQKTKLTARTWGEFEKDCPLGR